MADTKSIDASDDSNERSRAVGLQSAFELELSTIDETVLPRIRAMIVQQLQAAAKNRRHPWHVGVVSSVFEGTPRSRNVVLRKVVDKPLRLRFHTDLRSHKVRELRKNSNVQWLFYEAATRIQIRISCRADVVSEGEAWEQAWDQSALPSRRCYLGAYAPGTDVANAEVNLPAEFLKRTPTSVESEPGRANFAFVTCEADRIEWLYLKHDGHLRCHFERQDDGVWEHGWLVP